MKRSILLTLGLGLAASSAFAATTTRDRNRATTTGSGADALPVPFDCPDTPGMPSAPGCPEATSSENSCAVCGPSYRTGKSLSIQGSTTLRPIIDRVNQTVLIQDKIDSTGRNLGSTTGIRALIEGECERRGTWTSAGPCDMGGDGVVGTGDGPADIGISSRPATATEITTAATNGICLVEHPVAIDGLGIIVNNDPACATTFPLLGAKGLGDYLVANLPGPPLGGLSETQIKEILFGDEATTLGGATVLFKQWCDLVGCANAALPNITIVSRQEEGGTYGAFLDLYVCNTLDGTPRPSYCTSAAKFPANTGSNVDPFEWLRKPSSCTPTACGPNDAPVVNPTSGSSPTQFVGSNDEVVDMVARTCGAVGYAGISFIETAVANGARIKAFPVTQTLAQPPVAASFATVLDGTFDFSRKLYAYTVGTPFGNDPRALYLDTLFSRTGQANVYEAAFVPANGVLPRNAGKGTADQAQVVLEPIGSGLIKTSSARIETKLALVAEAEAVLADAGATAAQKRDATTDLIESEFSVRETVEANNLLVSRLIARVDGCIGASTCADELSGAVALAKAETYYTAAQSHLVPDNPGTPLDEYIQTSHFDKYLDELYTSFSFARKADAACNP